MKRFHIIDDGAVILRSRGVYRQVKLYQRDNALFAAHGSAFVGLRRDGATTLPDVSWDEIDIATEGEPVTDKLGRLALPTIPGEQK